MSVQLMQMSLAETSIQLRGEDFSPRTSQPAPHILAAHHLGEMLYPPQAFRLLLFIHHDISLPGELLYMFEKVLNSLGSITRSC